MYRMSLVLGWMLAAGAFAGDDRPLAGRLRERLRSRLQGAAGNLERIAGRQVSIWKPRETPASGAPLVIFSHGFHGSSRQTTFLMKALAGDGYLVIAPVHQDAIMEMRGKSWKPEEGFGGPDRWTDETYRDRAEDIREILAALRADMGHAPRIDWSRVALAGHSLGGYTVLGLAGGWPSWKLPGIKAVLALSPYANPFVQAGSLAGIHVPVMYQTGTRDLGVLPFVTRAGGAFESSSSPAHLVILEGAGHFAWTDLNAQFQESIIHYSLAFLDDALGRTRDAGLTEKRSDVRTLQSK